MTAEESTYIQDVVNEIANGVADRLDVRPLLTVVQAAERLNISESGVRNLMRSGKLIWVRVGDGGGSTRIEQRAIDAYLAGQRRQVDSAEGSDG